jgi:enoyl-CoA hydratase/carnithine racemase
MTVVTVDPGVLGGPTAPAALGALVDELGDSPTLVCFDGPWPSDVEVDTVASLRRLPALSIAVDCPDRVIADACDLVARDRAEVAKLRIGFESAPYAAVTAALLLRTALDDTWAGLVAESSTYSLLQSGPEFGRWLASRCPPSAIEDGTARVRVQQRGPIHEVVLTRGARHNALDARMRDELHATLRELAMDSGPIVLRAEGPSFCSGGDLAEFGTAAGPVQAHILRVTRSLAMLMSELAPRVVVALHGACIGAGIELPAFAARTVAADDARFGLPELGLGLVPGAGGTVSLRRRIGSARLLELLLSGGTIDAATAGQWGVVDEVVPARDLLERVYAIAEERA